MGRPVGRVGLGGYSEQHSTVRTEVAVSDDSRRFEQQVERIHSLIDGDDAVVTWNDRLPDPDNPQQARQIDVTIRRGTDLTLVECRIHSAAQDVTWIEELIGRRVSLGADAVIAVSASGFTRGAIAKAKAHGIVLRDFATLSEDEIRAWGKRTQVSISLHNFKNAEFTFVFDVADISIVSIDDVEAAMASGTVPLAPALDQLVEHLQKENAEYPPTRADLSFTPHDMKIGGASVKSVKLRVDAFRTELELSTPTVVAYDAPAADALERNTYVEIVEKGIFEISQSSDQVAVAMDVSNVPIPPNARLGRMKFLFTRAVEMREVRLLGDIDFGLRLSDIAISISFE